MLETTIFDQAHLSSLKQALQAYAGRHRVVADNIANVGTGGYRAQEYRFEQFLGKAQKRIEGVQTRAGHLNMGNRRALEARGEISAQESDHDNGVNNVDIDKEMASLVTTDMSYRLATRLLSMKYRMLRGAISGQIK